MPNTNKFQGLARGPIDHQSSSVINAISNGIIDVGDAVELTIIGSVEILPRVETSTVQGAILYGVVVGGDVDGIYGDGSQSTDNSTRASSGAGQGVVVVTQGRCLAKVTGGTGGIVISDKLVQTGTAGVLEKALTGDEVIATALNSVAIGDIDMIAVDVQREGAFA